MIERGMIDKDDDVILPDDILKIRRRKETIIYNFYRSNMKYCQNEATGKLKIILSVYYLLYYLLI